MMMTQCNKRSCPNSRYEIEKIESIPLDLIIEILTRLPVKSLARFRCVSKLWNSTASSPNFEESFFTISSSRPKKLLFACLKDGKTFFFSSPNPPLTVNRHMSFPVSCPSGICRPVHGLVCCINQRSLKEGTRVTVPSICNPSTGEYLPLPRVRTRRKTVINYLGYDPIEKQFKVLCMTNSCNRPAASPSEEHQVLTLGKKPSWRMISCDVPHTPNVWTKRKGLYDGVYDGICINGGLYYLARIQGRNGVHDIVCFDIRFEKFSYIKKDQGMMIVDDYGGKLEPTLVNHKGKLAKLQSNIVSGICTEIQLWVLEDVEKHEWSKNNYVVPPMWKNVFELLKLCFVGTSTTGKIVFSYISNRYNSFALVYYNTERNTITEFDIQGMEAFTTCKVYTFLDHVDDLKRIMG